MENINFDEIYNILESSFEPFLHRGYERQKALLENNKYKLITYKENDKILGFLSYWEIEPELFFVEHFAVDDSLRGKGIGSKIFKEFLEKKGDKVLEVEPPHTDIDKRRIKLYESFGFIFHQQEYYQPPYNEGDDKIRLHIMSSRALDNDFEKIKEKIYKCVYNI